MKIPPVSLKTSEAASLLYSHYQQGCKPNSNGVCADSHQDLEHQVVVQEVPAADGISERVPRPHALGVIVQLQIERRDWQTVQLQKNSIAFVNPLPQILRQSDPCI